MLNRIDSNLEHGAECKSNDLQKNSSPYSSVNPHCVRVPPCRTSLSQVGAARGPGLSLIFVPSQCYVGCPSTIRTCIKHVPAFGRFVLFTVICTSMTIQILGARVRILCVCLFFGRHFLIHVGGSRAPHVVISAHLFVRVAEFTESTL